MTTKHTDAKSSPKKTHKTEERVVMETPQKPEQVEAQATTEAESAANDDAEVGHDAKIANAANPLALKMARVMAEVRHVPKNGRNDFHKYDYIMESDLVDRLRGRLAEQRVMVFPSVREHTTLPMTDARGKTQYLATVTLDITFIDSDSGDQITTTWVGQGMDNGDKSYYKAYTGAFKYALLKTFLVTAEEELEPRRMRAPRGGGRNQRYARGR